MLLTILAQNVMIVPVVPPIPPTPPGPISGGGGGGSYAPTRHRYTYEQQEEDNRLERIKKDNEFIIEFLKTATNIINNQ